MAMPAATWPGVPSEFSAFTRLWMSLMIQYMQSVRRGVEARKLAAPAPGRRGGPRPC
jgi:hypothetical protein